MPLTLATLLARKVALDWYEGVAVAQGLSAALLSSRDQPAENVPDPRDIELAPDGSIDLHGVGPDGQSGVYRVARLVESLVPASRMPVQLRLMILTTLSDAPPFRTIRELTEALDYYERPNRRTILQQVWQRYQDLSEEAPASPVDVVPVVPAGRARLRLPWWWRHSRLLLGGAATAAVVGLALLGWWVATRPAGHWVSDGRARLEQVAVDAAHAVKQTAAAGLETVRARLGLESVAAATDLPLPAAAAATGPVPRPARPAVVATGSGGRPEQVQALAAAVPPSIVPTGAPPAPAVPDEPPVPVVVEDTSIHQVGEPGLVPPTWVWPKFPQEPPAGMRLEDLPLVEVTISVTGEVESVRLISSGAGVRASMMLSAVKAWRFQPATKNGRAVRCRHTVRLTNP